MSRGRPPHSFPPVPPTFNVFDALGIEDPLEVLTIGELGDKKRRAALVSHPDRGFRPSGGGDEPFPSQALVNAAYDFLTTDREINDGGSVDVEVWNLYAVLIKEGYFNGAQYQRTFFPEKRAEGPKAVWPQFYRLALPRTAPRPSGQKWPLPLYEHEVYSSKLYSIGEPPPRPSTGPQSHSHRAESSARDGYSDSARSDHTHGSRTRQGPWASRGEWTPENNDIPRPNPFSRPSGFPEPPPPRTDYHSRSQRPPPYSRGAGPNASFGPDPPCGCRECQSPRPFSSPRPSHFAGPSGMPSSGSFDPYGGYPMRPGAPGSDRNGYDRGYNTSSHPQAHPRGYEDDVIIQCDANDVMDHDVSAFMPAEGEGYVPHRQGVRVHVGYPRPHRSRPREQRQPVWCYFGYQGTLLFVPDAKRLLDGEVVQYPLRADNGELAVWIAGDEVDFVAEFRAPRGLMDFKKRVAWYTMNGFCRKCKSHCQRQPGT